MVIHCCYLLNCRNVKQHPNTTYIGYTINPLRRIRQHNGQIKNGAKRTSSKRPWEMVLVVYGFESKHSALSFEWNWQHHRNCKYLIFNKCMSGVKNKLIICFELLNCDNWNKQKLYVQFCDIYLLKLRKYCRDLPVGINLIVSAVQDIKYVIDSESDSDSDGKLSESEPDSEYDEKENINNNIVIGKNINIDKNENKTNIFMRKHDDETFIHYLYSSNKL